MDIIWLYIYIEWVRSPTIWRKLHTGEALIRGVRLNNLGPPWSNTSGRAIFGGGSWCWCCCCCCCWRVKGRKRAFRVFYARWSASRCSARGRWSPSAIRHKMKQLYDQTNNIFRTGIISTSQDGTLTNLPFAQDFFHQKKKEERRNCPSMCPPNCFIFHKPFAHLEKIIKSFEKLIFFPTLLLLLLLLLFQAKGFIFSNIRFFTLLL